MPISMNNIPSDLRVPLFYAEVDNSQANSGASSMPRLIVAQVNDDAIAAEIGQLTLVSTLSLAKAIGGAYLILPIKEQGQFTAAKGKTLAAYSYYAMCQGQQQSTAAQGDGSGRGPSLAQVDPFPS